MVFRKILAVAVLVLLAASVAEAQQRRGRRNSPELAASRRPLPRLASAINNKPLRAANLAARVPRFPIGTGNLPVQPRAIVAAARARNPQAILNAIPRIPAAARLPVQPQAIVQAALSGQPRAVVQAAVPRLP